MMQVTVDMVPEANALVTHAFVLAVVEETLTLAVLECLDDKNINVSLAFVSPEEIRSLNHRYRGKDRVTDILSFPEYATPAGIARESEPSIFLGELIVCYDEIVTAAEEDMVTIPQEMAFILSHGVLHLLGFEHSEEMFGLQDTVSLRYARQKTF